VAAGDVAAGVDHDHQDRPDGQWRERDLAQYGAADREDEGKRTDQLGENAAHGFLPGP